MKSTIINHQMNFWISSKYNVQGKNLKIVKAQDMKLVRKVSVNSELHSINEVDMSLFIYLHWLIPRQLPVKFYSTRSDLLWNWYSITVPSSDQFAVTSLLSTNTHENSYNPCTNDSKFIETSITIRPRRLKLLQKLLRSEAVDYYLIPASLLLQYRINNMHNPKLDEILFRFAGLPLRLIF